MAEFNLKKGSYIEEKAPIIDKDGGLKTANEYGNMSSDPNVLKEGRMQFFLKSPKLEKPFTFLKVCNLKSYRNWHNCTYKEGIAEAPIGGSAILLLTLVELEAVDQFPRGSVFETSIHRKIAARHAMDICSIVIESKSN